MMRKQPPLSPSTQRAFVWFVAGALTSFVVAVASRAVRGHLAPDGEWSARIETVEAVLFPALVVTMVALAVRLMLAMRRDRAEWARGRERPPT